MDLLITPLENEHDILKITHFWLEIHLQIYICCSIVILVLRGGVPFTETETAPLETQGPAFTDRALFCRVQADGKVELVDTLGLKVNLGPCRTACYSSPPKNSSGDVCMYTTPRFNIDTKNDGLEDVCQFKYGCFGYLC